MMRSFEGGKLYADYDKMTAAIISPSFAREIG